MVGRTKNSTFSRSGDHFEVNSMVAQAQKLVKARVPSISIVVRTKIRNLYLIQCLPAKEVASACGVSESQVRWLIHKYGWSSQRLDNEKRLSDRTGEKAVASMVEEVSSAIADECEELAMAGLKRAREAVVDTHKDAPKNYQAWTAGIRNLATARNVIRGSRDGSLDTGGAESRHINLFFMGGGVKSEKRVGELDSVL